MEINLLNSAKDLILAVEAAKDINEIIAAITHPKADESVFKEAVLSSKADEKVLEKAVVISSTYSSYYPSEILRTILESNVITPKVLCKIIEKTKNYDIVKEAVLSSKADETVLEKAVAISSTYSSYYPSEILGAILKSNAITTNLLCKIIERTKDEDIVKNAVLSSKADEKVLGKAVVISSIYSSSAQAGIYNAILKSNAITSNLLCKIIERTEDEDVVKNAVSSSKADETVLKKAEYVASSFSNKKAILSAIENRRESINNILHVQPPQISDTQIQSDAQIKSELEVKLSFMVESEDNVTERIRRNVEDGMSTMLWGLSGIGKTARVREIDPNFTMIKLKNDMLPEEVTGGKEPNGEPGAMYPPKWYVKLCKKCEEEPDKKHILFIDEITNVKNNVKSLVWDIIEDRRVNGDEDWQLPDNCTIVAAGNRPEESTSVITDYNGGVLPEPLHDRFDFHIEIPLDMVEWQQWALETDLKTGFLNIHPSVLSFCVGRANEVMFSSLDVENITKPRLSPRRWAKLSKAIWMAEKRGGKNCHVSNQRIAECIGNDLAPAFIAHYQKEPIDMKKVEQGLYEPSDFDNIDDKLFALGSLIAEYNGSELAVIDFIETCLGDDYVAIYNVMKKARNETFSVSKSKTELNPKKI